MIRWLTYRWHAWRFQRARRAYHAGRARGLDDFTLSWYASGRAELSPDVQRLYAAEAHRRGLGGN